MTLPIDAPNPIPRAQLALFIRGNDDVPQEKLIQDFEDQQLYTLGTLPALVAVAQATADAAQVDATAALVAAAAAQNELSSDTFLTLSAEAGLPTSRRLVATGPALTLTDAGAGSTLTLALAESIAILPADVTDNTAAFVNATGLVGALAINSTYLVEGLLTYQSASIVVGIGLGFTLPAGATMNGGYSHVSAGVALMGAYNNASGAVSANTTATPVINTNTPILGRWIIKTGGTAGNAQLQFRSSAAATTVTLKQDLSALTFRKIG